MNRPPPPGCAAWSDEFLTGFEAIDRQHRILVDTTARLGDAGSGRGAAAELARVLRQLVDYTLYHFGTEQRLMMQHGFDVQEPAAYATHLQQHQEFVEQVLAWQKNLQHGQAIAVADMQSFLMAWIKRHLLDCDRKLTAYLSARGIRE